MTTTRHSLTDLRRGSGTRPDRCFPAAKSGPPKSGVPSGDRPICKAAGKSGGNDSERPVERNAAVVDVAKQVPGNPGGNCTICGVEHPGTQHEGLPARE